MHADYLKLRIVQKNQSTWLALRASYSLVRAQSVLQFGYSIRWQDAQ